MWWWWWWWRLWHWWWRWLLLLSLVRIWISWLRPWTHFIFYFGIRGLPFISHLDSLPNFTRSSDGPVRLPIVDKYKVSCRFTGTLGSLLPPPLCPWHVCGSEKNTVFVSVYGAKFSVFKSSLLFIVFTKHAHTKSLWWVTQLSVTVWPSVTCRKLFTLLVSLSVHHHTSHIPLKQHLCL